MEGDTLMQSTMSFDIIIRDQRKLIKRYWLAYISTSPLMLLTGFERFRVSAVYGMFVLYNASNIELLNNFKMTQLYNFVFSQLRSNSIQLPSTLCFG